MQEELLDFVISKEKSPIIKVIGVGGGGGNAVNHMFRQGIHNVAFVVCNTDYQALIDSPVQTKIQLGGDLTEGLGAGNKPEKARNAAIESLPDIEQILSENTKMVFITAGMGGGTGTGAAPIIAKAAKDMGILTVGIVTIPFLFEGKKKIQQALDGVEEINKHVDALLVINNEKLREIYPDLELANAFAKADDVLANAAKGIAEIITITGYVNVDFADVDTTMRDGGVAIMNSGRGNGEKRITKAIQDALHSPLLNDNNIQKAKKILLNIYTSKTNQVKMDGVSEIHEFMEAMGDDIEVIWGATFDDSLEDDVKITIIATGFGIGNITPTPKDKPGKDDEILVYLDEEGNERPAPSRTPQNTQPKEPESAYNTYYGRQPEKKEVMLEDMDNETYLEELSKMSALKRKQAQESRQYKPSNLSTNLSDKTLDDENKLKDRNNFLHNNVD